MDISKLPTSLIVFLRDVSEEFALHEGETSDPAWVTVKSANAADSILREEYAKDRHRSFFDPSVRDILVISYEENNRQQLGAREAHLTLLDVHGLLDNGEPVFPVLPLRNMTFAEFQVIWNNLPTFVTNALWKAVVLVNPSWED